MMPKLKLKDNEILVLRSCSKDMTSFNGFVWPKKGYVEAPDWEDTYLCGNGLHGLPWGVGGNYLFRKNSVYLVVRYDKRLQAWKARSER